MDSTEMREKRLNYTDSTLSLLMSNNHTNKYKSYTQTGKHAHTYTRTMVMLCLSLPCFFHKCQTLAISVCCCERGVICHFHYSRLAHTTMCFYPRVHTHAHTCTHTHTHTRCLLGSISDIYSRRSISHFRRWSIVPSFAKSCVSLWILLYWQSGCLLMPAYDMQSASFRKLNLVVFGAFLKLTQIGFNKYAK